MDLSKFRKSGAPVLAVPVPAGRLVDLKLGTGDVWVILAQHAAVCRRSSNFGLECICAACDKPNIMMSPLDWIAHVGVAGTAAMGLIKVVRADVADVPLDAFIKATLEEETKAALELRSKPPKAPRASQGALGSSRAVKTNTKRKAVCKPGAERVGRCTTAELPAVHGSMHGSAAEPSLQGPGQQQAKAGPTSVCVYVEDESLWAAKPGDAVKDDDAASLCDLDPEVDKFLDQAIAEGWFESIRPPGEDRGRQLTLPHV